MFLHLVWKYHNESFIFYFELSKHIQKHRITVYMLSIFSIRRNSLVLSNPCTVLFRWQSFKGLIRFFSDFTLSSPIGKVSRYNYATQTLRIIITNPRSLSSHSCNDHLWGAISIYKQSLNYAPMVWLWSIIFLFQVLILHVEFPFIV